MDQHGTVDVQPGVAAIQAEPSLETDERALRRRFVNKAGLKSIEATITPGQHVDLSWVLRTPSFIRNSAIADAVLAYRTNRAKQEKQRERQCNTNEHILRLGEGAPRKKRRKKNFAFEVKFRSRFADQQSITISSEDWGRTRGIFANVFSHTAMRCGEPLPIKILYDFHVIRTRQRKWYLCVPSPLEVVNVIAPETAPPDSYRVIALDPGVRTFQTGFLQDGQAFEFGAGDNRRILKLCQHLDALESRRNAHVTGNPHKFLFRHKTRASMKRAAARMRERIRNLVDEFHKKLALWLCRNHDLILIPPFPTSKMAERKETRCIGSKTARMMYNWAHYRFRMRLMHKAREHPWCRVVEVREDYTSKTCGDCGWEHPKLKGAEVYRCGECGYVAGRDINAARNIFLRYLTERTIATPPRKRTTTTPFEGYHWVCSLVDFLRFMTQPTFPFFSLRSCPLKLLVVAPSNVDGGAGSGCTSP